MNLPASSIELKPTRIRVVSDGNRYVGHVGFDKDWSLFVVCDPAWSRGVAYQRAFKLAGSPYILRIGPS